jgi:hypothetical protein
MASFTLKVCSLTPSKRVVARDFSIHPSMTCLQLRLQVHPWRQSEGIDVGWLLYEEMQDALYESFLEDSTQGRCPVILQYPGRPSFPLYLGVCLDGLVVERLGDAIIEYRGEPCTCVLEIPGLATIRDSPSTAKHVASEGSRRASSFKLWITAGCTSGEFRGTVHIRGSTDWAEFINIIVQTCIDNHSMCRWSGSYMEKGVLAGAYEPSIYLIPPYLSGKQYLSPIVYGACFSAPLQPMEYAQPIDLPGLPRVKWSGATRYVPVDQWFPMCLREWGILVVVPSVQDAPFRVSKDFAKALTQELHDDCASFIAGHSMITWRVHSALSREAHLSSTILGLPGECKTDNPGTLKLHEDRLLARCTSLEKMK